MPRATNLKDLIKNKRTLALNQHHLGQPTTLPESQKTQIKEGSKRLYKLNPNISLDMLEEPKAGDSRPSLRLEVQKFAKARGWKVYHTKDSRGSNKGFPDLHMIRGKEVIYAELKRENQDLKPEQIEYRDLLIEAGQTYFMWKPSDWEQIVEELW